MKQLLIDPSGGMAGDMFAAALISAGADKELMTKAMWEAASQLGKAEVDCITTKDGSVRLIIQLEHHHTHVSGHEVKHRLSSVFENLELDVPYREFGMKALQILIEAEKQAHRENVFLTDSAHSHSHSSHSGEHDHTHHHPFNHHHHEGADDTWLHEAQDILIDLTGAAYGLQLLEAPVKATLLNPVSLGGGVIRFSHGTMNAPAPATKIILQSNWIPCQLGPIETELCTPTGACILAALQANRTQSRLETKSASSGFSRGTKDLPIPPLKIVIEPD